VKYILLCQHEQRANLATICYINVYTMLHIKTRLWFNHIHWGLISCVN